MNNVPFSRTSLRKKILIINLRHFLSISRNICKILRASVALYYLKKGAVGAKILLWKNKILFKMFRRINLDKKFG